MNELELIHTLKNAAFAGFAGPAIGDDCVGIAPGHIATTDMLMDGVHFDTRTTSIERIARKAVHVNLSDLAASGARPISLLVALALPRSWTTDDAAALLKHMGSAAAAFHCNIVGGDTNVWSGPLVINVTAIGSSHWRGQVTRDKALPGDVLFVTGKLGGSFQSGRHLDFIPRVCESQWLLDHFAVHAMMDLSDGLATDGRRLAEASQRDLIVAAGALPIQPHCTGTFATRLDQALCDGEDFELIFCVAPSDATRLQKLWPWPIELTQIGVAVQGPGQLFLEHNGRKTLCTKNGFVHA